MVAGAGFEWLTSGADLPIKLRAKADQVEYFLRNNLELQKVTAESPISSDSLATMAEIAGTELRAVVNYLRRNRVPIGSNGKGYFMARDWVELSDTVEQLKSRIQGIYGALAGLQKAFDKQEAELF